MHEELGNHPRSEEAFDARRCRRRGRLFSDADLRGETAAARRHKGPNPNETNDVLVGKPVMNLCFRQKGLVVVDFAQNLHSHFDESTHETFKRRVTRRSSTFADYAEVTVADVVLGQFDGPSLNDQHRGRLSVEEGVFLGGWPHFP